MNICSKGISFLNLLPNYFGDGLSPICCRFNKCLVIDLNVEFLSFAFCLSWRAFKNNELVQICLVFSKQFNIGAIQILISKTEFHPFQTTFLTVHCPVASWRNKHSINIFARHLGPSVKAGNSYFQIGMFVKLWNGWFKVAIVFDLDVISLGEADVISHCRF